MEHTRMITMQKQELRSVKWKYLRFFSLCSRSAIKENAASGETPLTMGGKHYYDSDGYGVRWLFVRDYSTPALGA